MLLALVQDEPEQLGAAIELPKHVLDLIEHLAQAYRSWSSLIGWRGCGVFSRSRKYTLGKLTLARHWSPGRRACGSFVVFAGHIEPGHHDLCCTPLDDLRRFARTASRAFIISS